MSDNYSGILEGDNIAGKISARLLPVYLRTKQSEDGYPNTIAFGTRLHKWIAEFIADRQINVKGPDGKPGLPGDKFFAMDVVLDESLDNDGWEMRWVA